MKGTEKSNRNIFCQGNEGRLRIFKKLFLKEIQKGLRNVIKTFINKMEKGFEYLIKNFVTNEGHFENLLNILLSTK